MYVVFVANAQKVDFPSRVRCFDVANVVGSADVRFKVRLEGLARAHARFCTVRTRNYMWVLVMVMV